MLSHAFAHDIRTRLANRARVEEEDEHIDIQALEYFVPLDPIRILRHKLLACMAVIIMQVDMFGSVSGGLTFAQLELLSHTTVSLYVSYMHRMFRVIPAKLE
eukprot:10674323-Karenia_brevis.AAC.1